jgi:hypothetical protein
MEMPRRGKRGKPNGGFPPFPTALGNRQRRDFHISTGPTAVSFLQTKNKPERLARCGRSHENTCSNQVEQVITTLVLSAFSFGRFWGDRHWPDLG